MLKKLELKNVGPAPAMELEFGKRLNILTGDNGLGKSFLLDIAWWSLTRKWPAEINPKLTSGKKAVPSVDGPASISFAFSGKMKPQHYYESKFVRREQAWTGRSGRPSNPGLVLYAMSDGGFAVWDPARNYWRKKGKIDVQDRTPAYVFSPTEVWDGLPTEEGKWLCNGLIRDWSNWQREDKGIPFRSLRKVLKALSPPDSELTPGELTRLGLDDVRDMPTIRMPYGRDVPLLHASAGIRRIVALSYLLIWAWEEHLKAAKILGERPTMQVIFLIDEMESHLHPRWQFRVLPSLLDVVFTLTRARTGMVPFIPELAAGPAVQLITATHSPMILASAEPVFNAATDAWFDLDYAGKNRTDVALTKRVFEKHGEVDNWLTSDAFDLHSARTPEYAKLVEDAALLLGTADVRRSVVADMQKKLQKALNPKDPFLFRWRGICQKKGLLS